MYETPDEFNRLQQVLDQSAAGPVPTCGASSLMTAG